MSADHIAAAVCYIAAIAVPAIAIAIAHARDVLDQAPLRDDDAREDARLGRRVGRGRTEGMTGE